MDDDSGVYTGAVPRSKVLAVNSRSEEPIWQFSPPSNEIPTISHSVLPAVAGAVSVAGIPC